MYGGPSKGKGKVHKKKNSNIPQYALRIVESATCAVCKSQCTIEGLVIWR